MVKTAEPAQPLIEQLSLIEKAIGAATIGLILGLSCPGCGVWWLAWCAMAPFLVLVRACKSWLEAVTVGVSFGFAYNLLTLFWLCSLHLPGAPTQLLAVLAAVTTLVDTVAGALPYGLFSLLLYVLPMRAGIFPEYRRPFFPYILSVPIAWIFFEYLSGLTTGIHINDLCYSQSGQLALIQIVRLGGEKLLTLLLVLSNTALAQLIAASANLVKPLGKRTDRLLPVTGALVDLMTVILLVALCALIGRGNPGSCLNSDVPAVAVLVSRSAEGEAVNIQGHTIVSGSSCVLPASNQLLYAAVHRSYLCRIFALPLRIFHFIYPPAGNALRGGLPDTSIQVVNSPWGRIGISCGAMLRPAAEKEEVRQGAGVLLCAVDPGCFHSTILDRQILAAAVMAAVENGRYLVLSNRGGISAVIDPCGKIVARLFSGTTSTLANEIRFLYRNTCFSNVDFN